MPTVEEEAEAKAKLDTAVQNYVAVVNGDNTLVEGWMLVSSKHIMETGDHAVGLTRSESLNWVLSHGMLVVAQDTLRRELGEMYHD